MNKLISFAIKTAIAALFLYFVSLIIVGIVMAILLIINRGYAYYKKHQRFTDWEFKNTRVMRNSVNNGYQFQRVEYFERFDRELNEIEKFENIIPIPIKDELGEVNSLFMERVRYESTVEFKRRQERKEQWASEAGIPYSWVK
jgi:cell shape-determining protein MreC